MNVHFLLKTPVLQFNQAQTLMLVWIRVECDFRKLDQISSAGYFDKIKEEKSKLRNKIFSLFPVTVNWSGQCYRKSMERNCVKEIKIRSRNIYFRYAVNVAFPIFLFGGFEIRKRVWIFWY